MKIKGLKITGESILQMLDFAIFPLMLHQIKEKPDFKEDFDELLAYA